MCLFRLEPLSGQAIFGMVAKHGALIGKPDLPPHDLHWIFAQLGDKAGIPSTQISVALRHSNLATIWRQLDLELHQDRTITSVIAMDGEGQESPVCAAGSGMIQ
jgi:integrase